MVGGDLGWDQWIWGSGSTTPFDRSIYRRWRFDHGVDPTHRHRIHLFPSWLPYRHYEKDSYLGSRLLLALYPTLHITFPNKTYFTYNTTYPTLTYPTLRYIVLFPIIPSYMSMFFRFRYFPVYIIYISSLESV